MNKKYTIKDNYNEIENAINAVISYTKIYATDMVCKIKCYNFDNGKLDIFAFNDISKIVLSEEIDKILVYYNTDSTMLITFKHYNNIDFEMLDIEAYEYEKEDGIINNIELCLND